MGRRYRHAPLGREDYQKTSDEISPEFVIGFHCGDFLTERLRGLTGVKSAAERRRRGDP